MASEVTESEFLESHHDDWYYIGPLPAGKWLALQDRWPFVQSPAQNGTSVWSVGLCDYEDARSPGQGSAESVAEWGNGTTKEAAWRYALGAYFGPIDDGYDETYLRRALMRYGIPDLSDPDQVERWLST